MRPSFHKILLLALLLLAVNAWAQDSCPDMNTKDAFDVAPQPLPKFSPQPSFPVISMPDTGIFRAKVIVKVFVDSTGIVKCCSTTVEEPKGYGFKTEVEKVIFNWKFAPALKLGQPIGVWVAVPFNFYKKKNPDKVVLPVKLRYLDE